jgi:hypothetical protein
VSTVDVPGWRFGGTARGKATYRCASDVCGAHVSGHEHLEAHDRAFHLVTLGPPTGLNGGGYTLTLDGKVVGDVCKYEQRYNLVRLVVDRGWRTMPSLALPGERFGDRFEDSDERLGPILDRYVAAHPLAKAWGRGNKPKAAAWRWPA